MDFRLHSRGRSVPLRPSGGDGTVLTKGDKLKGRSQKRALGADPPAGGSRPAIETISIRTPSQAVTLSRDDVIRCSRTGNGVTEKSPSASEAQTKSVDVVSG